MTLAEVMASALILGISAQTSLQGWGRSSSAVQAVATLQDASQALELYRLASLLLLRHADPQELLGPADGDCRFEVQPLRQLLERNLPASAGVGLEVQPALDSDGVWLELSVSTTSGLGPLQRRALLTPAGLGLCGLMP